VFIEGDPHPVLEDALVQTLQHAGVAGHVVAAAVRGESECYSVLEAVGQLYAAGALDSRDKAERSVPCVTLSARSPGALASNIARLREHLEQHHALEPSDLAPNLALARAHHLHRLAIVTSSGVSLRETLAKLVEGHEPPQVLRGSSAGPGKAAWVFSGQGSQVLGASRDLAANHRIFREALDDACDALDGHLEIPLRDVLWSAPDAPQAALLSQTTYTQACLFAVQWSAASLLRACGLRPDYLIGHSVGELVAACVADVFSLEDAA
jgi:acyl transferase domain-containing protein